MEPIIGSDGTIISPEPESRQTKPLVLRHPVVRVLVQEETKSTGKKYSSHGARRLTEIDRRLSKMSRRLSRAIDHGVDAYIDHRDKSEQRRRDGAVVDYVENASYGLSKTISEASPVIHDIGEMLNSRSVRRQIRALARGYGSLPVIG